MDVLEQCPELYEGKEAAIQCMDGRVNGGDGLAGSGILLERGPADPALPHPRYLKILAKRVSQGKLKAISWHPDCGAAGLYLKSRGNPSPTPQEVNAAAKDFVEKLAAALGVEVKPTANEMEHHSERGIYIDTTDRLNTRSEKLPNGFLLCPHLTEDFDYLLKEVEVAVSISFEGHGLGADSFSSASPYAVILVADPDRPDYFGDFATAIRSMIDHKFQRYANKIAVLSVTAPRPR